MFLLKRTEEEFSPKFTMKKGGLFPYIVYKCLGGGEILYEISCLNEILVVNLAVAASYDRF